MIKALLTVILSSFFFISYAQKLKDLPESKLEKSTLEKHLRIIASDAMMGRRTGEQGNNLAARYIAEQFRASGVKSASEKNDYFQYFSLQNIAPAKTAKLTWGGKTYENGVEALLINGKGMVGEGEAIFIGYGQEKDFSGKDVKDKIVVVQFGIPNSQNPMEAFKASKEKRKLAEKLGAKALVELYHLQLPWKSIVNYLNNARMEMVSDEEANAELMHFWVNDESKELLAKINKEDDKQMSLESSGLVKSLVRTQNVVGIIQGSDAKLKEEYVILSAHYDHVGTASHAPGGTPEDSIFNGARDNGMGVVGLIAAAKAFGKKSPSRSILFIAFTGEEMGLLGSQYYSEHPLVPLKKCIFNLNIDGAGYNDTSLVSVIGLDRTGAKEEIEKGSKAFGLGVFGDPSPEQGLFDRSDNVNFAAKGIPAPTFSEGFKEFDAEIMKNYHQVKDEVDTIDFDYLLKFCQSYVYSARLIANKKERPQWEAGDKYEKAAKALYGE
ncbi:MAG: M28 family peptidase [Flammeovirgaceae bacterium]|nr:M28 family peptidase [Flammeovirgaceae bacterium]